MFVSWGVLVLGLVNDSPDEHRPMFMTATAKMECSISQHVMIQGLISMPQSGIS